MYLTYSNVITSMFPDELNIIFGISYIVGLLVMLNSSQTFRNNSPTLKMTSNYINNHWI